jgi:hypothetical protein
MIFGSLGQTCSAFWDIKIFTITSATIMHVWDRFLKWLHKYGGALPLIIILKILQLGFNVMKT